MNFEVKLGSCSETWSVPVLYVRRYPAVSASYVCNAVQPVDIFASASRSIIACNGMSDQYFRMLTSSVGSDAHITTPPHQPSNFKFPKRSFGVKKVEYRCFQPKWFVKWPFLHYVEAKDVVFCHTCMEALKLK